MWPDHDSNLGVLSHTNHVSTLPAEPHGRPVTFRKTRVTADAGWRPVKTNHCCSNGAKCSGMSLYE